LSSGIYFARFRVQGKLILKSLKTNGISVAKLRLADLEKEERQKAENQAAVAVTTGRMTFTDALSLYRERLVLFGTRGFQKPPLRSSSPKPLVAARERVDVIRGRETSGC
jgi:hypothetical protein